MINIEIIKKDNNRMGNVICLMSGLFEMKNDSNRMGNVICF